jgi:pimeloyl-ACP methyl ester carboxylesterase
VNRRRIRIVLAFVIVLLAAGAVFERVASFRERRDPPGALVDVGGRRLHVLCIGSGRPTVVFEMGGRSRSVSFEAVRSAIARQTRVCSYDRIGTGWSDDGRSVITVGDLAEDLRRLQENTPIETPIVIVASSMGGFVAEMFARRFPDRVAGLALLDAGNSEALTVLNAAVDSRTRFELDAACFGVRIASPIGAVRLFDSRPRVPAMLCGAVRGLPQTIVQFDEAPPLSRDIPLVVLTAETTDNLLPVSPLLPATIVETPAMQALVRQVRESHRHLAARSTRGSWRLVRGSGHVIAEDRPGDVIEAVTGILAQVRRR